MTKQEFDAALGRAALSHLKIVWGVYTDADIVKFGELLNLYVKARGLRIVPAKPVAWLIEVDGAMVPTTFRRAVEATENDGRRVMPLYTDPTEN